MLIRTLVKALWRVFFNYIFFIAAISKYDSKFKLIIIIPHNSFLYGIENIQVRYYFNCVILFKINVY